MNLLFVHADGSKERRELRELAAVWQLPERLTPRPARLLTMGAPMSLEQASFRVLTFHRTVFVHPENWQGAVETHWRFEKGSPRTAEPHEQADMELWRCRACGGDEIKPELFCRHCRRPAVFFELVARWVEPLHILSWVYVESGSNYGKEEA